MKSLFPKGAFILFCLILAAGAYAQTHNLFNEDLIKAFTYRNIGPFRVGARISDFAVPDFPAKAHQDTFYVATWTGGLWKTTNNGTTFDPIFDGQSKLTIGDVTLAPSNPEIVWVGTGDGFCSRSSYAGDGVYKSLDGGKTWTNMGLKDSHHIPRIVIHPKNPDIVYVASMGHLYSENAERGVFKTLDGGRTWDKVFSLNEKIGVIDLVINPRNPDVLYAAAYDKQRLPWVYVNGGPESAIYKTEDAGKTWTKLGGGLPGGRIGRIGLDIYLKNPEILYALVENANSRPATKEEIEQDKSRGLQPLERIIGGEAYRTDDGGKTWTKMNPAKDDLSTKGPYYFSQIRIDPNDDKNIYVTGVSLGNSTDGGKTWHDLGWPPERLFAKMFGDVRTLWIDPQNSDRLILGSDGGVFVSYDGGKTGDHCYNIPLGEFYFIAVDMEEPYNIYGGLQDHEHWKGPSNSAAGQITILDWVAVGGGDGMCTQVDPTDSRWLFTTREYGEHCRVDQKLGYRINIQPVREAGKPPYRFLWGTVLCLSPHNSRILYTGGQVLLRSPDRGDHWQEISPDLSTNDTSKIFALTEGTVPGGIPWFAISWISESPLTPGIIWVGTSDGNVQLTRDHGATWKNLTWALAAAGGRADCYVRRVVASRYREGTAYVVKNGYKQDEFRPFIFRTDDFGETWTSLKSNLPNEPVNVIFEDVKNPELLFLGNDTGVFVTIDAGKRWVKMNNNMPNVAVHDLLVHPRENDLVVGSYGRGLFVTDISPLQEMSEKVLAQEVYPFAIEPKAQLITRDLGANDYLFGDKELSTPNEPNGIVVNYYLKTASAQKAKVTIKDSSGKEIAALEGKADAGINTVIWDTRLQQEKGVSAPQSRDPLTQWAPPGEYSVNLEVTGKKFTQKARITKTIGWSIGPRPEIIRCLNSEPRMRGKHAT